jgi:hypothetical protein
MLGESPRLESFYTSWQSLSCDAIHPLHPTLNFSWSFKGSKHVDYGILKYRKCSLVGGHYIRVSEKWLASVLGWVTGNCGNNPPYLTWSWQVVCCLHLQSYLLNMNVKLNLHRVQVYQNLDIKHFVWYVILRPSFREIHRHRLEIRNYHLLLLSSALRILH